MASSATYPDIGYNCVKWATPQQQKALVNSQNLQGTGMIIIAAIYLIGGLALSTKSRQPGDIRYGIPLIISGAIAMGTGVALVQQRGDTEAAYTTKTQNLLSAGWGAIVAPLAMSLIWLFTDEGIRRTRGRYTEIY